MFEKLIIALLLVITFGFIAGLFIAPLDPKAVAAGLIPRFKGSATVLMATSMLGATVMPHAIYLHSTLVNDHYAPGQRKPTVRQLLHGSKIDVFWALLLAGSVNLSLLVLAANSLYGMTGTDTIEGAQHAIASVLGPVVGTIFSIGLLASSLSSTSVGTYAGSEIMHGLLRIKAPMWACRIVTLVPALIVLWFAGNPTEALIVGQVVLSIGIPGSYGRICGRSVQACAQHRRRCADRRTQRSSDLPHAPWQGLNQLWPGAQCPAVGIEFWSHL